MPPRKVELPLDPRDLPRRIATPIVLALAGYSRSTLRNRQKAGLMPLKIDRGGGGHIFDRDAVLKDLRIWHESAREEDVDPWMSDPDEYRKALARQNRKGPTRNAPGP